MSTPWCKELLLYVDVSKKKNNFVLIFFQMCKSKNCIETKEFLRRWLRKVDDKEKQRGGRETRVRISIERKPGEKMRDRERYAYC